MDNRQRMLEGRLYDPGDEAILAEQAEALRAMRAYNAAADAPAERRAELLRQALGRVGEACYFEPPFYANWGGRHVFVGDRVYANFGLTMVDDGNIHIGSGVMLGPNVTLCTAGHPIDPALRARGLQFNADIRIGDNAWLGAGVIVCPGVTIGENTVVGAGSVVTRDLPPNVVAVGSPCRVLREIGEEDKTHYFRGKEVDL